MSSSNTTFITAGFDVSGTNFAAVYFGLDSHRLWVVPVRAAGTAAFKAQEYVLDRSTKIKSLLWTALPQVDRSQPMKKRKKIESTADTDSTIIALGTTQGTVILYSPAGTAVISTLKSGSSSPVCSITQKSQGKLFALQSDGTLTEFDIGKKSLLASSVVPVDDVTTCAVQSSGFVLANTAPYFFKDNEVEVAFPGFATPVRQVLPLGTKHFAVIADEDRQVLVYELDTPKPVQSLMCPATNANHISCSSDLSALAVTTEDGQVHVFENPTKPKKDGPAKSKKARAAVSQRGPSFTIEVVLEKSQVPLRVAQTKFADSLLQLVWSEQVYIPVFDTVQWRLESGDIVSKDVKLEKQPAAPLAKEHLVGGVDPASVPSYDDNTAKVVSGDHVADLSDEEEEETLAEQLDALEIELAKEHHLNGARKQLNGNQNAPNEKAANEASSRLRRKDLRLKLSQPGSFATLLNQALTLNDKQLLEICLDEKDPAMIKTSIVKLEPSLAAALLEHLASTMAHSQNRSATLTQWIRWVVVIHGGYLVTLPNLLKTLAALHATLSTRAATLPRLLALQGRLELLEEQLTVRNDIAAAIEEEDDMPEAFYDEEDEAIIVNGEETYEEEYIEDLAEEENDENEEIVDEDDKSEDDEIMLSE